MRKAFAVFAFCAEMTREPGHWSPSLAPVKATARTIPLRSTTVDHMFRLKPPFGFEMSCAVLRAASSCAWVGRLVLPDGPTPPLSLLLLSLQAANPSARLAAITATDALRRIANRPDIAVAPFCEKECGAGKNSC